MYVRSSLVEEEVTVTYKNRSYLIAPIVSDDLSIWLSSFNIRPRKLFFCFTSMHFTIHSSLSYPPLLCFSMLSCSRLLAEAVRTSFVPKWCVMGTVLGWASFKISSVQCCATSLPSDRPAFSSSTTAC